jgi:hypothetical protein
VPPTSSAIIARLFTVIIFTSNVYAALTPDSETPLGHRLFRVGKKEGRVTGPPSCIGVDWLDRYGLIFRPGHCENAVKFPPFPNGAAARQPKLLSLSVTQDETVRVLLRQTRAAGGGE